MALVDGHTIAMVIVPEKSTKAIDGNGDAVDYPLSGV